MRAWRAQRRARERGRELLPFALESLQREVQAAAPLAERRVRLGEQPRNAGDRGKVDVATRAAPRLGSGGERPVAARAREQSAQIVGGNHRVSSCGQCLELIVAATASLRPCMRSRYVKTGGKKNNGYPAIRGRVTVVRDAQRNR